jgi:hypothetical protein
MSNKSNSLYSSPIDHLLPFPTILLKLEQDRSLVPFDPTFPHWFGWIVANLSVLNPDTHMTVQGMQQQSHSTPSPHGHEMHGLVEPLMGFEMDETTDEGVDEGGMAGQMIARVCLVVGTKPMALRTGSLTWKDENAATT